MEPQQNYWTQLFDEVVAEYDEPQEIGALRKLVIERAVADVEGGYLRMPTLSPAEWASGQFAAIVMPERKQRSQRLSDDLDYLLDGFREDGAYVDPLLQQARLLGDKRDHRLGLWTIDHWHTWAHQRLANAAKTSAAAHEANVRAERMQQCLVQADATYTRDLYR